MNPDAPSGPARETAIPGRISFAEQLAEDILAIDVTTSTPFVYAEGQDATLAVTLDEQLVQRRFSLAGTMEGDTTTLARFMIRRNPGGVFTAWLFDSFAAGELAGAEILLALVP